MSMFSAQYEKPAVCCIHLSKLNSGSCPGLVANATLVHYAGDRYRVAEKIEEFLIFSQAHCKKKHIWSTNVFLKKYWIVMLTPTLIKIHLFFQPSFNQAI